MQLTVTELEGSATRIALEGRMDAAGADAIAVRFSASVAGAGHGVVVDMSGVEFIASMGLRLLISAARALHGRSGHKMVLFGAQPLVQGVFDDAALADLIPIVASEGDALGELAA